MSGHLDANDTPGEHPRSWYVETAGEIPAYPRFEGEARAEVCVIGGGYAGLSAALHLAEAGREVVLLEANRVGWGASGRNGGQLGVGPRADIRKYERLVGREDARRIWDIAVAGNRLVRALIARHAIDCELVDGHLLACWKRAHVAEAHAFAEHVARHYGHTAIRPVSREEMAEMLGTRRYWGGHLDMWAAHLHPLRYALGLARAAAGAGARIFERSRVSRIEPGRVVTECGAVTARHIVVACNGYIDGLVPEVGRRAMPINNFVAVTEPLGAERARRLIRDDVCVSDTKFVLNYFHLTRDHRMLWGGGESYGRRFPRDIAGLVRSKMLEVYPDLADVRLTHAWGGTLAITATRFPLFRRIGEQVWAIGGWSGSGIHMATIGGQIVAEAIMGERARWDLMARLPAPPFPGGVLRPVLLAAAMTWYSLRDRL